MALCSLTGNGGSGGEHPLSKNNYTLLGGSWEGILESPWLHGGLYVMKESSWDASSQTTHKNRNINDTGRVLLGDFLMPLVSVLWLALACLKNIKQVAF